MPLLTKLPNGAFTVVSDIDFNGFSLKNIPDPIDGKDAVNKAYVNGKTIQPAAPIKPITTLWAEKKVHWVMVIMTFRSVMVVADLSTLMEVIV